eukprot:m.225730 g.225730  ORF g.225730 m.225730 type:complete len:434 (+) comp19213_c0_seq4:127-1428(+)
MSGAKRSAIFSVAFLSLQQLLHLSCSAAFVHNNETVRVNNTAANFGHEMLAEFYLADGFTNLNHGSFGATPRSVIAAQHTILTTQAEARPDDWFRKDYKTLLSGLRARMAQYINANKDDVVFVENASSGINAILRAIKYSVGDYILILDCAYGMVKNTLDYLKLTFDVEIIVVELPTKFDSDRSVEEHLSRALEAHAGKRIRFACFSHIVSVPAVVLPVERLAQISKANGVDRVIVDGAHALGHIDVNMRTLEDAGVDFWMGNGHKWLYSPKGSAVLWVPQARQNEIVPTVVSSEWRPDTFLNQFEYTGTRDYTPFVAMNAAMDFRERVGGSEAITTYMHDLAAFATSHLVQVWGTESIAPASMQAAMANVRLPVTDPEKASTLRDLLYEDYDIYIVVYKRGDSWWTRLSAQIYVDKSDFVRLGEAVLALLKE